MANPPDTGPRREPNRPVKPRKDGFTFRPIIAIEAGHILLENGEVFDRDELPRIITTQPSSILVAGHFGPILRELDRHFEDNPQWQFRLSPIERSAWQPNANNRKALMKDCVVGYLGFKGKNKKKGHYHFPICPHTFILKSIHDLRRNAPGETSPAVRLMEWAKEVRDFLEKNNLRLSPTSGGIAAQLLKDKRFYPEDRRKVPRHTNAKAREHLPGNFYKLYNAKEGISEIWGPAVKLPASGPGYSAAYLDQISAHHSAAASLAFPCANTLRERGRFQTLQDRSYARAGTKKFESLIREHGLFYLAIEVPQLFPGDFPLPECDKPGGYHRGYFYSNELPYLKLLGVRIRHIIAMWTSPDRDYGLNRYSEWASKEIADASPLRKNWLKPTLLSTYGVLAAKPKLMEFGYKQAEGGEPKQYACGSGFIDVIAKTSKKLREPMMANVLHRGMVESETRLRSLEMARELTAEGHSILAIYADSVFVEGSKQLPLLKPPWRLQEFLTGLKFESATHFTSAQISKTPGIPSHVRGRSRVPKRPHRSSKTSTQN